MKKTSCGGGDCEAMFASGKKRRDSTTKLPEGYARGGVPGGKGGGMGVGASSHAMLRRMGSSSPSSMSPGKVKG